MLRVYYHLAQTVSMASLSGNNVTWLLPFDPDLHLSLWRLYWEYNVTWLLPFGPDLHLSPWRLYWYIMLLVYYHFAQTSICLYGVFIVI